MIVFKKVFYLKIYKNNNLLLLFLKIIFNINILNYLKIYKN